MPNPEPVEGRGTRYRIRAQELTKAGSANQRGRPFRARRAKGKTNFSGDDGTILQVPVRQIPSQQFSFHNLSNRGIATIFIL